MVKRLIRRFLLGESAYELVGITLKDVFVDKTDESAFHRLSRSVDNFTARWMLSLDEIDEIKEEVRTIPHEKLESIAGELSILLDREDRLASFIRSLLHDEGLLSKASNYPELKSLIKRLEALTSSGKKEYAVLVADGDFMGSKVLRGSLRVSPEEYFVEALEIDEGKETVKGVAVEIYSTVLKSFKDLLRKEMKSEDIKLTALVTPSYEYSVSRALIAGAYTDGEVIRQAEGYLIYAGGDDVLAILPPVRKVRGSVRFEALETALKVRRNYWGEEEPRIEGFHRIWSGGLALGIAPALRAYGRSAAVLYTKNDTPLWVVLSLAHALEELKDLILVGDEITKDVTILASETSGLSILPNVVHIGEEKYGALRASACIASLSNKGISKYSPSLSRNVFRDALDVREEVLELMRAGRAWEAYLLLRELLRRNIEEEGGTERFLEKLGECVSSDDIAAELLKAPSLILAIKEECSNSGRKELSWIINALLEGGKGIIKVREQGGFKYVEPLPLGVLDAARLASRVVSR